MDALEPDRLVDTHHDREGRVDLGERLEDAGIPGLGEPLTSVALGHVEAAEARVAQLTHQAVAEPLLLLDLPRVDVLADLARGGDQPADPLLLVAVRLGPREHHLLVDLPAE